MKQQGTARLIDVHQLQRNLAHRAMRFFLLKCIYQFNCGEETRPLAMLRARRLVTDRVHWYNGAHRHSSIGLARSTLITPAPDSDDVCRVSGIPL